MKPATTATIDLAALRHNLARVRAAAPGCRVATALKANAYGHGLLRAARALAAADVFAVARCDEAMALREAGIGKPILVLEGFLQPEEIELCRRHGLHATVHHESQLRMLELAPRDPPIEVWLKIDTGMHRLGFAPERVPAALERLAACPNAAPNPRLMSHLARADDRADPYTRRQLNLFKAVSHGKTAERSLANSGGILGWPETHFDWVRPGIMLYGCSPFSQRTGADEGLRPVMTLASRLIAVQRYAAGEAIGYSGTWVCPRDSRIGVVAIGYGDGYPRHAPSGTPLLVNGRRAPLVGRVSMDMLTVDLSELPEAEVGDPVILWGRGLPAEEIASKVGTITYELFCKVTPRVVTVETGLES
ncbi:MAG TPA: alanine racemase [Candidatus Competibacter sp.]|nr:alanine racemase [Candidatus Competibacteraceae bacterium]HRC73329.1 alanine racemase [Candidatus Competibacter sp.]